MCSEEVGVTIYRKGWEERVGVTTNHVWERVKVTMSGKG